MGCDRVGRQYKVPYIVFIDDAQTNHPDYIAEGTNTLDRKKYLEEMNYLFDCFEEFSGAKVIIASHPQSEYAPEDFNGRQIVKGNTCELVSKCGIVITHGSTAVSFAVLFEKRVTFVITDDMIKLGRDVFINQMASEMGKKVINISELRRRTDEAEKKEKCRN